MRNFGLGLLIIFGWGLLFGVGFLGMFGSWAIVAMKLDMFSRVWLIVLSSVLSALVPWTLMGGCYVPTPGEETWPRQMAGAVGASGFVIGVVTASILGFGY